MSLFNIDGFIILEPRIDWISIVGDIPEIDYEDTDTCNHIQNQFYDWGFMKIPKRDRLTFRSNIMGVEISFAKKRGTGNRYGKIEVQGKGCSDNAVNIENKIREITRKIWDFLGIATPPHATRIDLAVDILGARLIDIFPDISDKRYSLVSNSTKEKRPTLQLSKYHRNPYDLSEQTGFTIGNSRFEICGYDRVLAIDDKYSHQENGAAYCEYYRELYKGHDRVFRLETRLSKELCEYFNTAFFTNKKPLREIVPEALAHFNHHHKLVDTVENKPLEHIDRLYFSNQYKSIKAMKTELELDLDLKKLFFNLGSTHFEVRINQLARSLVRSGKTTKNDIFYVVSHLLSAINKASYNVEEEIRAFNKTCKFFNFHPHEQAEKMAEFLKIVYELKENRINNNKLLQKENFLSELDDKLFNDLFLEVD